jgi:hypothetical protein
VLLAACTRPAQNGHVMAASAAGNPASNASAGAFAELNALGREASALKNPLAQYEFYRDRHAHSDGVVRAFIGQVLAAKEAELGAYEQAVLQYPQGAPVLRTAAAALPDPARFRAVAAVDAVAALARERRIVMANEAHHVAQTRVLTLELLPRLRALGFTHFAAEGLSESDRDLAARGYPVPASGPYIDEPLYGEIIRSALRLGFIVVAYESAAADDDSREEEQARHIVERVFRGRDDARLLVHAGYAHVHKRATYLDTDTMAMRLARKTGLDPLVIDQTVLRPVAPGREYADYRRLLDRFAANEATAFVAADSGAAWSLEREIYDVSVLLPPSRLVNGRPDWLALGGERSAVAIGLDLQPASLPCVLEARYAGEPDGAVPADRILVERADTPTVLFLRPGDYRVAASTSSGRTFAAQRLHVVPPATDSWR